MRRAGRKDKDDFIQSERFQGFARKNQVGVMNRIECSTVDADFFHDATSENRFAPGGRGGFNSSGCPFFRQLTNERVG